MAWTTPKTNFANGDVLNASEMNAIGEDLQYLYDNAGAGIAAKNKILNADFSINQRNFTSTTTNGAYGFDRWRIDTSGGTSTYSTQAFTPGAAPVAGYEAANYARVVTSGQSAAGDYSIFVQAIEDVRTFAGQTVTVSFWAKAASGTPKIAVELVQNFGSGGSPSAEVYTAGGAATLTTGWVRYSKTITVPSISGKTIGTTANTSSLRLYLWVSAGSTYNTRASSIGIQNATFDIWGVQVEAGSSATAFTTCTGIIESELAACQRYYVRFDNSGGSNAYSIFAPSGMCDNSTTFVGYTPLPVTMRIVPTAVDYGGTISVSSTTANQTVNSITLQDRATNKTVSANYNVSSGLTASTFGTARANNSTTAYVGFSAEF